MHREPNCLIHCSLGTIMPLACTRLADLPRTAVAPPLDSCFQRPARPANRRPPSRWAAHSPSSSPSYNDRAERFHFPSPPRPAQASPETEESSQEPRHLPA